MRRWVPVLAIIALLTAGLLFIRPAPELGSFTLSDGTVFEVVKISTGQSHLYRFGNRWQDFLGLALPSALRVELRARILEVKAPSASSLVVWTKSSGGPPLIRPGFEIAVADESSIEVPVNTGGTLPQGLLQARARSRALGSGRELTGLPSRPNTMATLGSNVFVAGWLVTPLPHHARDIGVVFYENQNRLGYSKVQNPAYRRAQKVTPEHLPLVKPVGDIQLKLSSVTASRNSQQTSRVDWAVSAEVLRDGTPASDWQVEGVEVLSDGEAFAQAGPTVGFSGSGFSSFTGGGSSSFSSSGGSFQTPSGRTGIQSFRSFDSASGRPRLPPSGFPGWATAPLSPYPGLWPDAVWNIRLKAVQHDNFTTEQIWVLNNVPVTNATEWTIERKEERQIGTTRIELLGFRGPQVTWSGTNGNGRFSSGSAGDVNVCFAAPPQSTGVRITFVRGRDDLGRTLDSARASESYGNYTAPWTLPPSVPGQPQVTVRDFSVRPAADAKTLTLEFAVHEARSVDFVVKPTFAK